MVVGQLSLLLCLAMLSWMVTPGSIAQTITARLSGVVTDESGGVLPGAQVTVTNEATGMQRSLTTDQAGRFVATELPPGPYQVVVTVAGFETLMRTGLTLVVGQDVNLNLTMKLGAVTERVTVSEAAPLVNITNSSVSGVVDEKRITELPLNGRDFIQLSLIQPGILNARNANSSLFQKGPGLRISMAGSRPDQTRWLLDGTNVNTVQTFGTPGGSAGLVLGVDAIREFQVLTSNYGAEFGGTSGGVINMVSKSGANQLHGTAHYYNRNDGLDARNFFDVRKPSFLRNQFGASLGGPIRKDKAFFFGAYEGIRQDLTTSSVAIVPDADARKGILSTGQVTVAPEIRGYLDLIPLPNGPPLSGGFGTLAAPFKSPTHENYFVTRADYHINESQFLFARFSYDQGSNSAPDPIPTESVVSGNGYRFLSIQHEKIFTPFFLGTSRAGFNRTSNGSHVSLNVNYPASLMFYGNKTFPPQIVVVGMTQFGPSFTNGFTQNYQNLFEFTENLVYTPGSHSFKFGADVQIIDFNQNGGDRTSGSLQWSSLPAFLTDQRLQAFNIAAPGSSLQRSFRQEMYGLYFQDDWKMRPNFTLNLGLRYEPFTLPSEKWNRLSNVAHWLTDTRFTVGAPLWVNPAKKNFAPRVGFAWDPGKAGKSSLRAGFGIFYEPIFGNHYSQMAIKNPPFATFVGVPLGNLATIFDDVAAIGPSLATPVMNPVTFMETVQYQLKSTYAMKFNSSFEHELPGGMSLTLGYMGMRGIHLWRTVDANSAPSIVVNGRPFVAGGTLRPNRNTGGGNDRQSNGQSYYNALQVTLRKQLSHGLEFQSSYTWSKNIDNGSTGYGPTDFNEGNASQPYNPAGDRGLSTLNVTHNWVLNGIYALPPLGKSGFASHLLDGWRISGIFSAATGTPFSALLSDKNAPDLARSGATNTQRPDLVAGRSVSSLILGTPNQYFDPKGFVLPPSGFYGNAGRNILIGLGLENLDFSLMKIMQLKAREGSRLEFHADFFNTLNRANFAIPSFIQVLDPRTGRAIPTAGKITSTVTSSRQIQLGLKLII